MIKKATGFRRSFGSKFTYTTLNISIVEHILYSDGDQKRISWTITTGDAIKEQFREHADIYLDKITDLQSKYIALHVGIFWSIGVFIIKNQDTVRIMIDSEEMMNHMTSDAKSEDPFVEHRKGFINQLASQRDLKFIFEKIDSSDNVATKLLRSVK